MEGNRLTNTAAGTGNDNNLVCTIIHDLISLLSDAKNKRQRSINE